MGTEGSGTPAAAPGGPQQSGAGAAAGVEAPYYAYRGVQRSEPADAAAVHIACGDDVEMQAGHEARVELSPTGGTTCCEKASLLFLAIISCYLWFGLLVVLPVCLPKTECGRTVLPWEDQKAPECGMCKLFYEGGHIPYIASMVFAGFFYFIGVLLKIPVSHNIVSLASWLRKCERYMVQNPFTRFHIECYHNVSSGSGKDRKTRKVVTHTASTEWHCTSSVDESTLPTFEAGKAYRVDTHVKMFMADRATNEHWKATKKEFFRANTRDRHQTKTVQHGIPGLANNLLVHGGSSPPPLYGFGWYVLFSVFLLCAPYRLYVYCVTVRADVVFIKRVWRAAQGQAV